MFIGKCVLGIFTLSNLLFAYYHTVNHDICKVIYIVRLLYAV